MFKENLVGKTFGDLTVVRDSGARNGSHVIWECVDSDGNIRFVRSNNLKRKGFYTQPKKYQCNSKNGEYNKKERHQLPNQYEVKGGIAFVKMYNCDDVMLCDEADWMVLKNYVWSKNMYGYASANLGNTKTKFHTQIMPHEKGMVVDHINGNKLDNRRENLRVTSKSVNTFNRHITVRNSSNKVGVYKHGNKWIARICVNNNRISLGSFELLEDAIQARKEAELKYYGEYCSV